MSDMSTAFCLNQRAPEVGHGKYSIIAQYEAKARNREDWFQADVEACTHRAAEFTPSELKGVHLFDYLLFTTVQDLHKQWQPQQQLTRVTGTLTGTPHMPLHCDLGPQR